MGSCKSLQPTPTAHIFLVRPLQVLCLYINEAFIDLKEIVGLVVNDLGKSLGG